MKSIWGFSYNSTNFVGEEECRSSRSARGFTLVELLVVIAIIGVLVALLLPAIQAAREAARRTQCSNNLKQIGLAMHGYHDTHQVLPYGSLIVDVNDPTNTGASTWVAHILPFMEQQTIYDLFNFHARMTDLVNRQAVTTPIDTFICPSDPQGAENPLIGGRVQPYHNQEGSFALWYPASMGPTNNGVCSLFCPDSPNSWCCRQDEPSAPNFRFATVGIFGRHTMGRNFREIPDGTSQTMMVGEGLPEQCAFLGAYHANYPMHDMVIALNNFTEPEDDEEFYRACGFKSLHPGGANAVMADASVHFLTESIDYRLWCALGTRAGGESITADAF